MLLSDYSSVLSLSNTVSGIKWVKFNGSFSSGYVFINKDDPLEKPVFGDYTSEFNFSNDYSIKDAVSRETPLISDYLRTNNFNNSMFSRSEPSIGEYNMGILPIDVVAPVLNNSLGSDKDYSYFEETLENISTGSYMFDNSVKSLTAPLLFRAIPWNYSSTNILFSLRFPEYGLPLEWNVSGVLTDFSIQSQFEIHPWTPEDVSISQEFNVVSTVGALNIEWIRGEPLSRLVNIQYEISDTFIYMPNIQYQIVFDASKTTSAEYRIGFMAEREITLETNLEKISKGFNNEVQYGVVYNEGFETNLEYSRTNSHLYPLGLEMTALQPSLGHLNLELTGLQPAELSADIEFNRVYRESIELPIETNLRSLTKNIQIPMEWSIPEISKQYAFDLEASIVYHENIETPIEWNIPKIFKDYALGIEVSVQSLWKEYSVPFEFNRVYRESIELPIETNLRSLTKNIQIPIEVSIPEIWKDFNIGLEYSRVYHDHFSLDLEYNVENITKRLQTSLEWLIEQEAFYSLPFEFSKLFDSKVSLVGFVVPFAYRDETIMLYVKASMDLEIPNLEWNITDISKYVETDLEFKTEILYSTGIDLETNLEKINKDFQTPIEFEAKDLWLEAPLNVEYSRVYHESFPIDIEVDTVVETDYELNVEWDIPTFWDDTGFEWEFTGRVPGYFEYPIEFNVSEVTRPMETVLEFDILDLVYYMMYNGRNIVPWWSDGKGRWDPLFDPLKKWNKTEDPTLFKESLKDQLRDINVTLTEELKYMGSEGTFGTIVEGVTNVSDLTVSDKIFAFKALDSEGKFLTLGKRKKDKTASLVIKHGRGIYFWDGLETETSDVLFGANSGVSVQIWKPRSGEWVFVVEGDAHPLYFYEEIDGKTQPMPYILLISNLGEEYILEYNR